jgi:hypothetical protein
LDYLNGGDDLNDMCKIIKLNQLICPQPRISLKNLLRGRMVYVCIENLGKGASLKIESSEKNFGYHRKNRACSGSTVVRWKLDFEAVPNGEHHFGSQKKKSKSIFTYKNQVNPIEPVGHAWLKDILPNDGLEDLETLENELASIDTKLQGERFKLLNGIINIVAKSPGNGRRDYPSGVLKEAIEIAIDRLDWFAFK